MDGVIGLFDTLLGTVMALAQGVIDALGTTGSVMLVMTAAIGLIWIAGRTLKL